MTKDEQNTERFESDDEIAWCPGCGNFAILTAIKTALLELNKRPEEILIVSGIGQAAKLPHYIRTNVFNAKIVNPELTVIVHSGDGDTYGEGGNHFLHNIRRNVDIAHFVHDNQIYALTKGQASPTTALGQVTGNGEGKSLLAFFTALKKQPSVIDLLGWLIALRSLTGFGNHEMLRSSWKN